MISIVIPTYQRPEILRRCLDWIEQQTCREFEVIVVTDGPDPKTDEMIANLTWRFSLQYFAIPKSQQGVCRNRAAERAQGKYCLLIGDDIFLAKDACEKHLQAHEKLSALNSQLSTVLGFTTWDPTLRITPCMRWMEENGVQFGYPKIQRYAHMFLPQELQHWFTYTSHLSLPTKLLQQYPFREDVSLYGWEDIEWGWRLAEAGIRLYYEPTAQAFHHHHYTDEEVWERSTLLGRSAREFERLSPALSLVPRGWKQVAYRALALLPTYRGKHCRAFLRGCQETA
jgi:GT2 family glycosyltransferase